jgi:uncharacterized protein
MSTNITRVLVSIALIIVFGCKADPQSTAVKETLRKDYTAPEKKTEKSLSADARYIVDNYSKSEHRIQMRDATKLYTAVYSPKNVNVTYPIILHRTPYSSSPYGKDKYRDKKLGSTMLMTREKFIFVYQDVRGMFMSEGEYENMRPINDSKQSKKDVDESTDAFDTIDWLVKNIPNNNGKVGIWGISYPGFYAASALVNAHPALKAVSPQAPIADWFFDDFYHNGAFFLSHAFGFFYTFNRPRKGLVTKWPKRFEYPCKDSYDFFLNDVGPLTNVNDKYYKDEIPYWKEVAAHPNYDNFWQSHALPPHLKNVTPAVMIVGGWYDAEDLYGSFKTYESIEKQNPNANNILVVGPWNHGGWARTDGTKLGKVFFTNDPAPSAHYLEEMELPFFKHHLKGTPAPEQVEARMFETGTNKWRSFDTWPPAATTQKNLFLSSKGALEFNTPEGKNAFDEFESDPSRPVPYTEAFSHRMTKEYMTDDQRFAARRPDVLVYQTAVLEEGLTLAGKIRAHLEVSTTAGDADWVIKVIDVYPDDHPDFSHNPEGTEMGRYQQMVRSEVFRGRFRDSYSTPAPFKPGKKTVVEFQLQDVLHTFKKGHRLMVHIQSTWFPIVARNPQKWVPSIFEATAEDYISATHRVYRSKDNASYVRLGILKKELPQDSLRPSLSALPSFSSSPRRPGI